MADRDLICDLVIDAVCEWLGLKYRKSQIKLELAQLNGGKPLDIWVFNKIVHAARTKIRNIYHIDAIEYKGSSIEFYELVIRDPEIAIKYKLVAQQRLDTLLGLEHLATDDPIIYAEKVAEALKAMDNTVDGIVKDEQTKDTPGKSNGDDSDEINNELNDPKLAEGLKGIELDDDGLSLKSK